MIDSDDVGLDCLHHMDPTGSLLTAEDLVVPGEVHVLLPSQGQPSHGQHVDLPEVGGDGLQLGGGGAKPGGGGPGVPVVAADNGLKVETLTRKGGGGRRTYLGHHLGSQELIVNIRLPTHLVNW